MIQNGLKILKNMNNVNLLNVPLHAIIVPAGLTFTMANKKIFKIFSKRRWW